MKLTLITLAHRPDAWAQTAADDYARRFPKDWRFECLELKPEARHAGKPTDQILLAERDRIFAAVPKGARLVALDERGVDLTSHQMAGKLQTWHDAGDALCLIIGSADGLHPDVKQRAHERWRLSSLTLPHALARVVLTEALYRAWSILHQHPYHRD